MTCFGERDLRYCICSLFAAYLLKLDSGVIESHGLREEGGANRRFLWTQERVSALDRAMRVEQETESATWHCVEAAATAATNLEFKELVPHEPHNQARLPDGCIPQKHKFKVTCGFAHCGVVGLLTSRGLLARHTNNLCKTRQP